MAFFKEVSEQDEQDMVDLMAELTVYYDRDDMLRHMRKFFDGRADADYPNPGLGPIPNHDMKILCMIDDMIEVTNKKAS